MPLMLLDNLSEDFYGVTLRLVNEKDGADVDFAGFRVYDVRGQLGLGILNKQFQQQQPQTGCFRQRFVSGKEYTKSRQRLGIVYGHFVRILEHTNVPALTTAPQDFADLIVELLWSN